MKCIFVSDLHGKKDRYDKLFKIIEKEKPKGIFIGGDILPNAFDNSTTIEEFLSDYFFLKIKKLKQDNIKSEFFVILGNDDPRIYESYLIEAENKNLIKYIHNRTVTFNNIFVTGYSFVPPTPFKLKDWEKFDVSQYVDIGAISPNEGVRSIKLPSDTMLYTTIADDLEILSKNTPLEKTIFLFHCPPYNSYLDRANLDGKIIDHAPVDIHVGSIAIQRFIKKKQPLLTLHGHVHESTRITGKWREKIGKTYSFNAANDGSELALVRFDYNDLDKATRVLI